MSPKKSKPLNLDLKWFKDFAPYTVSKYGMTMLTMGMAQEFSEHNIAVNCLWPRTAIATAAIEFAIGDRNIFKHCRTAEILADAAHELLTTENCSITGQALLDEDFLSERGYTDFAKYAYDPDHANELLPDFFLD
jgi:NAD(P)-dependent dehydrogenase (short-subunit alcohol dehydrogenase family)